VTDTIKLYATCPNEITDLLAKEISAIGGTNVKTGYRVVYFDGTEEVFYRAHLQLRLASRLFRVIKEFPAHSPTIVFDKAKRIKFHEYFKAASAVKIGVTMSGDNKVEGHLVGTKIREAITDSFKHYVKQDANISSWDATVNVQAYVHSNRLMLSVDTAGKSMHKRGYRMEGHPAPLKETLAATLLNLCEYDGTIPLMDPMCGSGTIVIEGCMMAMNKAPMIHRKKGEFGFEELGFFKNQIWKQAQDDARAGQKWPDTKFYASDIDPQHVEITRESALRARVEKYLEIEQKDFFDTKKPEETGLLITNLPYGIRLDETQLDEDFLKRVGDHLKENFKGWKVGLLMPEDAPFKAVGLKPSRKYPLMNGALNVKFYVYDMY